MTSFLCIFVYSPFASQSVTIMSFCLSCSDISTVPESSAAAGHRVAQQCQPEYWKKSACRQWDGADWQRHHRRAGRTEGTAGSHQRPSKLWMTPLNRMVQKHASTATVLLRPLHSWFDITSMLRIKNIFGVVNSWFFFPKNRFSLFVSFLVGKYRRKPQSK